MTEKELQMKAAFYASELWGETFDWPVKINNRLRKNVGMFVAFTKEKECWIEVHSDIFDIDYLTDNVLIHELCHWKLWKDGRKWKDNDAEFIRECKKCGSNMGFLLNNHYSPMDRLVEMLRKYEGGHDSCQPKSKSSE